MHVIFFFFFIQNRLGGRGKLRIDNYASISRKHFALESGFLYMFYLSRLFFIDVSFLEWILTFLVMLDGLKFQDIRVITLVSGWRILIKNNIIGNIFLIYSAWV